MPFKEGRNHRVKVIRLTLDPVKVLQRPLILYCFVFAIQRIITYKTALNGFREIKDGDTRYLIRIPAGWKPSRTCVEANRPLLFVHGLGMGLPQYATLVGYLAKAKVLADRPIVILVQPHISMSFFARNYLNPPNEQTSCAGLERMVKRWGFDKCGGMTVLSHSNGTVRISSPRWLAAMRLTSFACADCSRLAIEEPSRPRRALMLRRPRLLLPVGGESFAFPSAPSRLLTLTSPYSRGSATTSSTPRPRLPSSTSCGTLFRASSALR